MTRMELEEQELVSEARRAMAPNAADRARVRASLTRALATLPDTTRAPETSAESGSGDLSSAATAKLGGAPLWAKWTSVVAMVSVATGVGYFSGYRAGLAARTEESRRPSPPPLVTPPPVASATASTRAPEPMSSESAPRKAVPLRASSAPPRTEASAREGAVRDATIDEELRTLRRAERALRQENPRLALVLLEELNRTTKGGRLAEERAAEMAIARCALEPSEAPRLSQAFERTHPNSVYLERVKESCRARSE